MAFTRKMDDLGRISIPKEVRKGLGWNSQDEIEMSFLNDKIVLSKYFPTYESYLFHVRDMILADEVNNKEDVVVLLNEAIAKLKTK